MDGGRNPHVRLSQEFHAICMLLGAGAGNDPARWCTHGEISGDTAGGDYPGVGVLPAASSHATLLSGYRRVPVGREPALSAAPVSRARLAGARDAVETRIGLGGAVGAWISRADRGVCAVLPGARHLLSDRDAGWRLHGRSGTPAERVHAELGGKSGGHADVCGTRVFFLTAMG